MDREGALLVSRPPPDDGGITIQPTPSFVVKTTISALRPAPVPSAAPAARVAAPLPPEAREGQKVFLNITHHDALPPFARVERPTGEGEAGAGGEGLSVPMSMGPPTWSLDKAGERALAVDIIVHPGVTRDAERDASGAFRHWLISFCLQYFARKHGAELSPQYRLPALIYKGDAKAVATQRIRRQRVAVLSSEDGGGSGSGAGASTPAAMQLLALAGALPEATTALVPTPPGGGSAQRAAAIAAAGAQPPRRMRGPPSSATGGGTAASFDLRVLNEEREAEAAGVAGAIAAEISGQGGNGTVSAAASVGGEEGQAAAARLLRAEGMMSAAGDAGAAGAVGGNLASGGSSGGGGGIGLTAAATRKLSKPPPPPLSPSASVILECAAVAGDDKGCTATSSRCCPLTTEAGGEGDVGPLRCVAALPWTPPPPDLLIRTCLVEVSFPLSSTRTTTHASLAVSTGDELLSPLSTSSLSVVAAGDGTSLTVRAPGYRALILSLPMPCCVITSGTGEGADATPAPALWRSLERTLFVRLVPRSTTGGGRGGVWDCEPLPDIPSDCALARADDALMALLRKRVELGGVLRFAPDVGSRPWLLAQAVASSAPSVTTPVGGGPSDDASPAHPEEESALPEDRFHANDALSLHYLRQREEDVAKRKAKAAEKAAEKAAAAGGGVASKVSATIGEDGMESRVIEELGEARPVPTPSPEEAAALLHDLL